MKPKLFVILVLKEEEISSIEKTKVHTQNGAVERAYLYNIEGLKDLCDISYMYTLIKCLTCVIFKRKN